MNQQLVNKQLAYVLEEIFHGHASEAVFLDDGEPALIALLEDLSAEEASLPIHGDSVAAQARHVLFSLGAYRKALSLDAPGQITDNWPDWENLPVTPEQWRSLIADFKISLAALVRQVETLDWDGRPALFALAALAHMAFHLGAVREKCAFIKLKRPASS